MGRLANASVEKARNRKTAAGRRGVVVDQSSRLYRNPAECVARVAQLPAFFMCELAAGPKQ